MAQHVACAVIYHMAAEATSCCRREACITCPQGFRTVNGCDCCLVLMCGPASQQQDAWGPARRRIRTLSHLVCLGHLSANG